MIEAGLAPRRVFLLREAQTSTGQYELVVVVVEVDAVHEADCVVDEAEVHAGDGEALRGLSLGLILGLHLMC